MNPFDHLRFLRALRALQLHQARQFALARARSGLPVFDRGTDYLERI